ncbi:MAG: nitrate reductase [Anaerolineae bacterium]|jgi:nitrate reductase delta subunit|nr:nitrate reductase [Anaerolineae bacterium]MBT4309197.1 nitrate reductase [Anaerolineae bacterium]MBT4458967.1 nitrate reductase [Anaerolineae bacterium]MBT4843505.1 nitrate reductase [Anaerolineae bacterium]MBT6059884.1 nitrate reductase [Anaerolineae bacterium]
MDSLLLMAEALRYPHPGQVNALYTKVSKLNGQLGNKSFTDFLTKIESLSLSEQEELFTRTLDLSPLAAPYVGYQIWGESYKRGEFMAQLNHEMKVNQIDLEGELPDHLRPILQYLSISSSPLPELIEVLETSIKSMRNSLKKTEKDNPYLLLFDAIGTASKSLQVAESSAE